MAASDAKPLREWWPLEASPEVFTQLARSWGVSEEYSFIDVFSLDSDYLATIDRPVHAAIFLFPDTPKVVKARKGEGPCMSAAKGEEVVWIPQAGVGHSCGTFALVHALGVTRLATKLNPFFDECRRVDPVERTALFAENPLIYNGHHGAITAGQSVVRESDWEDADHFLSFVQIPDGHGGTRVVEMDGNDPRDGPLDRGEGGDDLLKDVANIIRHNYLPHAGDNIHFSLIALVG